jgi:hypothetical protein
MDEPRNPYAPPAGSSQNPYAPPTSSPLPDAGPPPYWDPERWEPSELINTAWETFKLDWGVLVPATVLGYVIMLVPSFLSGALAHLLPLPLRMGLSLAGLIVAWGVQAGWIALFVASARGNHPPLGVFFEGGGRVLPFIGTTLLHLLALALGIVALIVPVFILAPGLSVAVYFTVDRGLGPIDSLFASWRATMGHKLQIFMLFILIALVNFAGAMACCVGLLASVPIGFLALALLFVRLTGSSRPAERETFPTVT